ncbi:folylpolyglutamate synthase/dihydrofolate synthase family protein [Bartonella sp. TP]|uniref:bifunctional folylpolyglutamate synthase/dihydrofolate synthase n=1 Tax=Bartonella sp. TP TaxID=3057550 RepID=UPI0025AF51E7|nr:folylpolyglutamate synthase/dihydrofolate synthase family protein [Bartonella sp. TP]WJW80448.1 folylpolyglutamate synthase/dihydrofolate synthase family protein [Bartonella sp. TP]
MCHGDKLEKIIKQILQTRTAGWDLSLGRISKLLKTLGNCQENLPRPIHIAGTNGKGSTASFCRALLESAGYSTHVFSSPHLVSWRERFRLNGKLIETDQLCELLQEVTAQAEPDVTLFEILTASAMLEFSRVPADATIFEVGLGGRLDATNVIPHPACCIITPISFDHCTILGSDIATIAAEKAAIIKPGCQLVVSQQLFPAASEVIMAQAEQARAKTSLYGQDFMSYSENGQMIFQNQHRLLQLPKPCLPGEHQLVNAASAIEAIDKLGLDITEANIAKALRNSYWPGRLQRINSGKLYEELNRPIIWLDGAHNAGGAQELSNFFAQKKQKVILIMGMLDTKDYSNFLRCFKDIAKHSYFVPITDSHNAVSATTLCQAAASIFSTPCSELPSLGQALTQAAAQSNGQDNIIVTGSLHLVGEFLKLNNTPPWL